ncbi:MAG: NAD(P)/FAD-dependent oxidoreductase, partial [Oceanospirillum sp.]|nr:NAD(P)/FAD-dependent oxidoreductase [Oceanospirillum sp.]
MEFDVVIVGAGPAGLSAAIRLMQQANDASQELTVCVVEKGSEVGAHILSGAVIEPTALNELIPDWKEKEAPLLTAVTKDQVVMLKDSNNAKTFPNAIVPKNMHNDGNYIASLGNVCRWLATQAEEMGVEIFPGFAAAEPLIEDGVVKGVITGDMGVAEDGSEKPGMYMP